MQYEATTLKKLKICCNPRLKIDHRTLIVIYLCSMKTCTLTYTWPTVYGNPLTALMLRFVVVGEDG